MRPNTTIHCFSCRADKPVLGAVKFFSHFVCRDCATRLQATPSPKG